MNLVGLSVCTYSSIVLGSRNVWFLDRPSMWLSVSFIVCSLVLVLVCYGDGTRFKINGDLGELKQTFHTVSNVDELIYIVHIHSNILEKWIT